MILMLEEGSYICIPVLSKYIQAREERHFISQQGNFLSLLALTLHGDLKRGSEFLLIGSWIDFDHSVMVALLQLSY